jgi:anti-sigma factor RsiW
MGGNEQINSEQAQLLLYLAGELSTTERRALEAKLSADTSLRQQLADLQRIETSINQTLSAIDASDMLQSRLPSVERQTFRAIAQWNVDRHAPAAPAAARMRVKRVPVWLYPLAAAALVMVGLGIWWLSLEALPDGVLVRANPQRPDRNWFDDFAPENLEEGLDLALGDTGSDSFEQLERDMSMLQATTENLQ